MYAPERLAYGATRALAGGGGLLYRGDLVTVRETSAVERCATRHQVVFTRSQGPRVRLGPPAPAADPTRVQLLNAGDAPVGRHGDGAAGGPARTVLALAPNALGVERGARPFARAQATVGPRALLALHALRAALARPLPADVRGMAVEEAVLALVAQVLAAPDGGGSSGALARMRRRRDLVAAARDTLAAAPGRAHHLADVAAALGISPSHLAHVFTAEVGMPLHRYLLHLRLAVALERLADGEPQLSAVALDLGFATHSHFSAAFRRWCGVTPAAARAMLAAGRTPADVTARRAAS